MTPRAIQAELDATYAEHLQAEANADAERSKRAVIVSEYAALLLMGMVMGFGILGLVS